MSFIRPELLTALARRQDHAWAIAGLVTGALVMWRGVGTMAPFLTIFGGGIAVLSAVLWVAHRQRAAFRREVTQPGIVQIDEAQISYYGPETGGVVDRDALIRVDLVSGGDGRARWALYHSDGSPVSIPLAAEGADKLVDLLMSLPRVEVGAALSALDRGRVGLVTVWTRAP